MITKETAVWKEEGISGDLLHPVQFLMTHFDPALVSAATLGGLLLPLFLLAPQSPFPKLEERELRFRSVFLWVAY